VSTAPVDSTVLLEIAVGITANLLSGAIVFGLRRIPASLLVGERRGRRAWVLGTSALVMLVGLSAAIGLVFVGAEAIWVLAIGAATLVWVLVLMLRELRQFWAVGLLSADPEIAKGISYAQSLRLVTKGMAFMGTGAHKLSGSKEFAAAIDRCSDRPVRLLLRRPDDPVLEMAAARKNRNPAEYRENVIESLQRIGRLRQRFPNIQVKFYEGEPVFRIMLVDERLALVSFNVYGRGDGSALPQLHVARAAEGKEEQESFYQAFSSYFERCWTDGKLWDFREFL